MKNGLFKFYFIFMVMSLMLFSCENHDFSIEINQSSDSQNETLERKPENRHPLEPNEAPASPSKTKKHYRKNHSRSSNWC